MENHSLDNIIGNHDAPYLNSLAARYALAKNYYSTAHPSLPNYIQLTSGTNGGITSDCNPPRAGCQADVKNIADLIEASGRSWKEYAESMPAPCTIHNSGLYAVKHNPFAYYPDITKDASRCQKHIVPLTELDTDLTSGKLPDYMFITPNLCNDMHNCPVRTGDEWLSAVVSKLLGSKPFGHSQSLLVVTWDEGAGLSNHIPTILAGPAVKRGYSSLLYYSHYSLLATIEKSWNLAPLTGNDTSAPLLEEFFK